MRFFERARLFWLETANHYAGSDASSFDHTSIRNDHQLASLLIAAGVPIIRDGKRETTGIYRTVILRDLEIRRRRVSGNGLQTALLFAFGFRASGKRLHDLPHLVQVALTSVERTLRHKGHLALNRCDPVARVGVR